MPLERKGLDLSNDKETRAEDVAIAMGPVPKPKTQFPDSIPVARYIVPEPVPEKEIVPPEGLMTEAMLLAAPK